MRMACFYAIAGLLFSGCSDFKNNDTVVRILEFEVVEDDPRTAFLVREAGDLPSGIKVNFQDIDMSKELLLYSERPVKSLVLHEGGRILFAHLGSFSGTGEVWKISNISIEGLRWVGGQ